MAHYRWVQYHSPRWHDYVACGWVTMQVREGMALMYKETKL